MIWTEKEKEALDRVVVNPAAEGDLVLAVANKAAELLAARRAGGGTMTAEELGVHLQAIYAGEDAPVGRMGEVIAAFTALGARNAVLEAERDDACDALQSRLTHERQHVQQINALALERDTLSQRLTETNQRAQENWEKQEAERERLRNELGDALVRAGQAEARVRQLAIAGQELSAAVHKHVSEPNPSTASNGSAPTPGHPDRVKERSEAFNKAAAGMDFHMGYESGVEAMRAACLEALHQRLAVNGMSNRDSLWNDLTAAIEGAAP